jgi:hypothetical protein
MGSWQNSHCGIEKRKTRHINGAWGWFGFRKVFGGGRLDFWVLTEVLRNLLHNVLRETKF